MSPGYAIGPLSTQLSICAPNTYKNEGVFTIAQYIGRKAATSLLHSARTAEQKWNRPLNWMITINFWQLGSSAETIFTDFAELREKWFARWSRYAPKSGQPKNGTPTYTYVHEATHGQPHTHWLVHLHPGVESEFGIKLLKWIERRWQLDQVPDGAVQITRVHNAEGAKLYLAKGMDPHLAQFWRIRPENTGYIANRKAGTSRNLGPKHWREVKQLQRRRPAA